MTDIFISSDEVMEAAEILIESRCDCEDFSKEELAKVIANHLEDMICDILGDPEYHLKNEYSFWRQVNRLGN